MTKGLRTLGISKSAIFLMVFMNVSMTSSFSIFEKDSDVSGSFNGEKHTIDSKETGLISKMLSRIDSDTRKRFENKQFFSNRHWYFKPRRKVEKNIFLQQEGEHQDTQQLHSFSTLTNIENAERKPQKISSKNNSKANDDLSAPSIRRKRSPDKYGHLFNFPDDEKSALDSKANEDRWKSDKKVSQMYHKSSSSILHILENGSIVGKVPCDKYCELNIKPVGYVDSDAKTKVKIFGIQSRLYIALNKYGKLYTTRNASHEDTDFLHEYEKYVYDAYLSFKHRRYITMRGDTQSSSSPGRARRLSSDRIPKKNAHFLVSGITPSVNTHNSTTQISEHTSARDDVAPTKPETLPSKTTAVTSTQEQLKAKSAVTPDMTSLSPTTTITTATGATSETTTTKKNKSRTKKPGRRCRRKERRGKKKSNKRCKKKNGKKKGQKKNRRKDKRKKRKKEKRHPRSVETPYFNDPATEILNILGDFENENLDRVIARILQSPNFFDKSREVT